MSGKKIWDVDAVGHTNGAIEQALPTAQTHKDVLCQDGKKRDFWECDYRFITKLLKSQSAEHLEFKVFYRERRHAPVRLWPFLRRKRMTLETALKKGVVKKASALAMPRSAR